MEFYVLITTVFLISFVATWLATKIVIRKTKFAKYLGWDLGFVVPDMARKNKPLVPKLGGLGILAGFCIALLFALKLVTQTEVVAILATLSTVLIIGFVGLFDDLFKTRQIWRLILPALAALPLMAITAGTTVMDLIFWRVDFGIYYSLILVPIGVVACANFINMLAGHNGLEAGTGSVICLAIFTAAVLNLARHPDSTGIAAIISIAMAGACLAFLFFNWYPSRVFPGSVGTYAIAATIVCAVILGNIERIGVIAVIPQITEFLLKSRSKFKAQNFGKLKGNRLHYEGPIYSLTHVMMKYFRPTEKQLTVYLILIQIFFGALAVSSLYWGI